MRVITYHGHLDRCQYMDHWFDRDRPREVDDHRVITNCLTPAGRALGFFVHPEVEVEPLPAKRGPGRPRKNPEE